MAFAALTFSYQLRSLKMMSSVNSYGPSFLLRMTLAISISLTAISVTLDVDQFHGKKAARISHLKQMVKAKLVHLARFEVRRGIRKGKVTGGGDPPRVTVMQYGRAGKTADGVGEFLARGNRLNKDAEFVAARLLPGLKRAHHA